MGAKKVFFNVARGVQKQAPLLFMIGGVAAAGATVYFAVKAVKPLDKVVTELEGREVEPSKIEAAKAIAPVIWKPVVTGTISLACFTMMYYISNKRIAALSTALTVAAGEMAHVKAKFKEEYGEEKASEFFKPNFKRDPESEPFLVKMEDRDHCMYDAYSGVYLSDSEEIENIDSDPIAMARNESFIQAASEELYSMFKARGFLTLREVYDQLGIPTTLFPDEYINYLGWIDGDNFTGLDYSEVSLECDSRYPLDSAVDYFISFEPVQYLLR